MGVIELVSVSIHKHSSFSITPVLDEFITLGEWAWIMAAFGLGGASVVLAAFMLLRGLILRVEHAAAVRERHRVARNLHDGVSHGLVVMAMHARRLRAEPPAAVRHQTVEIIEGVAQATLADLSATLGVLRRERVTGPHPVEEPRKAAPLSSRLIQLVRQVPAARLVLELHDIPEEHRVPPAVAATAFRVAQEVLTNALKHRAARLHLGVRFGDELTITMTNEMGRAGPAGYTWPCGGFGLAGLREQVAAHGGLVHAGPLPDGRYITRAVIPVGREEDVCVASAC